MDKIRDIIQASAELKSKMTNDNNIINTVKDIVNEAVRLYKAGGKILAAGNGGSAADAQHFVAEYVGRFYYDRPSLPAIALTTDTSVITAIGNDYGYDYVFSRQVESMANKGDMLVAISTSGNSPSIINAIEAANNKGVITVGMTGQKESKMDNICRYIIKIPSTDTPRIQEGHALIEHIICELVEETIFPKKSI